MMFRRYRSAKASASSETRIEHRSMARRILARLRGDRGNAIVEFAIVFPLLIILVMGIISFGQAYGIYQTLTNAASAGAQAIAISRGQSTDPCITASGPVFTLAHYLNQANIKFTITVSPSGSTVPTYTFVTNAANPSCTSAAASLLLAQYDDVKVQLTYPVQVSIFGVNFVPAGSVVTAQTWEVVQ